MEGEGVLLVNHVARPDLTTFFIHLARYNHLERHITLHKRYAPFGTPTVTLSCSTETLPYPYHTCTCWAGSSFYYVVCHENTLHVFLVFLHHAFHIFSPLFVCTLTIPFVCTHCRIFLYTPFRFGSGPFEIYTPEFRMRNSIPG